MWLVILIVVFSVFCVIMYMTRFPKCKMGGRCNGDKSKVSKWEYNQMWGGMTGGNTSFYCSKCGKNVTDYLEI